MKIELNNPLPLVSINALGIGIDLSYGTTATGKSLVLCVNFLIGTYSRVWSFDNG